MQFKKGKKTLALVLAIMLSLSITGGVYAAGDVEALPVNTFPFPEEAAAILAAEEPLVETYNEMIESFRTRDGNIAYPDSYGGAYIADGDLHINITEVSAASTLISDAKTDNIVYHLTPYSYGELEMLVNYVRSINFPNVVNIGIKQQLGKVNVGIDRVLLESLSFTAHSDEESCLAAIQKELEERIAEVLSESSAKGIFDINNLPINVYWSEKSRPAVTTLQGGMLMVKSSNSRERSLGICGYFGDDSNLGPAVLTCGHSTSVGDWFKVSGTTLGQAVLKRCSADMMYDYSVINITNDSAFTPTSRVTTASGFTTITRLATTYPVEGSTVWKCGRNGFATGTVDETNVGTFYADFGAIYGLTRVNITASYIGTCGGGDSGGSVYAGSTFYGLYASDNSGTTPNATYFYFSPVHGVPNFYLHDN